MKSTSGDAWGDAVRVRYLKTICGIVSHAIYQTDAGKPAPVFCVRTWWIIGADPVKVRPIRAGGHTSRNVPPGRSGDRHGQTGQGRARGVMSAGSRHTPGRVTFAGTA